jgi:chromate reductase
MPALQQPEMYVGQAKDKFDDDGKLTCPKTTKLLVELSTAFAAWIDKTRATS